MSRMFKLKKINFNANICFIFVLILVFMIYFPGLKGAFLFDDYSNLGELTRYGDLSHWENIKKFISNGIAGPTGRPISLITFVPQADYWPNDPYPFKIINLIIHLLCGVLLFKVTSLLLLSYGYKESKAIWAAFISSSIWLLHPLFVSTTLYVIQRMAQLPLLFSLLGMLGYFKAREYISIRPYAAYSVMTLSIGLATVLATYSKENGALLPLLILVIEFCNPTRVNQPIWYWRAICLWLPSLAIGGLLYREVNFSDNPWPTRNFNQIERLWSEGRIICDYLYHLFIPRIEGYGLFQDGYVVSKGWLDPVTTLISALFLALLFVCALFLRRKYPLFALAVLFFFAAHLIESTFFGLELYFEHRNYFSAIFLFLPLAMGGVYLTDRVNIRIISLVFFLIFMTLAGLTWQRAVLWSNDLKLQLYWAQNNLNSPRAQSLLAQQLLLNGQEKESLSVLERAIERRPDSGMLVFQLLLEKVVLLKATQNDFDIVSLKLRKVKPDTQTMIWVRDLTFNITNNSNLLIKYADAMNRLLLEMGGDSLQYKSNPEYEAKIYFLQSSLNAAQNKKDLAYEYARKSFNVSQDVKLGIYVASDLGNKGAREQALMLLDEILLSLEKRPANSENLSYKGEVMELREKIYHDIQIEKKHTLK